MRPGPLLEPVPQLVRLQRHPLGIEHAPSLDVPALQRDEEADRSDQVAMLFALQQATVQDVPEVPVPSPMLRALQPMDVEQVLDFLVLRTIELVDHALLAFLLEAENEEKAKMDRIEDMILEGPPVLTWRPGDVGRSTLPPREEGGRKGIGGGRKSCRRPPPLVLPLSRCARSILAATW